MKPAFLLAACGLLLAPTLRAQSPHAPTPDEGRALAFHRAATLTDGINASGWFGGWGDYTPEHTSTWLTPADFKRMHDMGIRYVRFPLDPTLFARVAYTPGGEEALWKRIDDAIDEVTNAGLAVDLCVFPRDDYKQQLNTQAGVIKFAFLWQKLATHFASRDPNRFFFELINEGEAPDRLRWIGVQSTVVAAIREVDTQHTIIAAGADYGSLGDLLTTEPLSDTNVIYNLHFYEPYQFTHQGATWGSPEWVYFKDIPFPATPEQIAPILKSVPGEYAKYQLFLYGQSGWNKAAVQQRLGFAAAWARERNVPLICNEFGAFRDTAPPDSRARYIEAVRSGLEANGIGWGMWDWSGNFGLVKHENGQIIPDPAVVQALGLKMP
jgi:aryl-phospho-beta-D-glucosidase BglC (GH1 family)